MQSAQWPVIPTPALANTFSGVPNVAGAPFISRSRSASLRDVGRHREDAGAGVDL
jgi:hypothetical protein